jgi:thiamine-monophosphate kinase
MKVSELGEFGLVARLEQLINSSQNKRSEARGRLVLGIGDDAAAWRCGEGLQLATVDSLREGIHFNLDTIFWRELGWKSLAVNLSDIAAMGGSPKYALVTISVPGQTEVDDVVEFYKGMLEIANKFDMAIIGGDTDCAPKVDITVTVLGNSNAPGRLLTRSAAKAGEKIAVTGYLGGASAGLEMVTNKLEFNAGTEAALRKAFYQPEPRVVEGQTLVEKGVNAAIDISDGLVSDLRHICKASKLGGKIYTEKIPVHPAVKTHFAANALQMALSGGEDYELLFTASDKILSELQQDFPRSLTVIGEMTLENTGEVVLVDSKGQTLDTTKSGWEHFKAR